MNCPICLEEMNEIHKTECNHEFCNQCIEKWLEDHYNCPLCRHKLKEEEEEEPFNMNAFGSFLDNMFRIVANDYENESEEVDEEEHNMLIDEIIHYENELGQYSLISEEMRRTALDVLSNYGLIITRDDLLEQLQQRTRERNINNLLSQEIPITNSLHTLEMRDNNGNILYQGTIEDCPFIESFSINGGPRQQINRINNNINDIAEIQQINRINNNINDVIQESQNRVDRMVEEEVRRELRREERVNIRQSDRNNYSRDTLRQMRRLNRRGRNNRRRRSR